MNRCRRFGDQTPVALLMAGPAVTGLILFILAPFLTALMLAFTNLRLGSPLPVAFVGLKQFQRIFTDPDFCHALANTLVFALGVVPMQTLLALGLALLVDQGLRGTVVFRILFFMPVVFPMSLVSVRGNLITRRKIIGRMKKSGTIRLISIRSAFLTFLYKKAIENKPAMPFRISDRRYTIK